MTATCANPSCSVEFEPRRPNHRYHAPQCRIAAFEARRNEGLKAIVKSVRMLTSGKVSLLLRVTVDESEAAMRLRPGRLVTVRDVAPDVEYHASDS